MFEDVAAVARGVASQLGLTFFVAGFIPALTLVVLNQYVFFGAYGVWDLVPQIDKPLLGLLTGEFLTTLALALALAVVLVPLNLFLTRLFEGLLPGMRQVLAPFYAAKRRRHAKLYAPIQAEREARHNLLAEFEAGGDFDAAADAALQRRLQQLHAERERTDPLQRLPYERPRLTPTEFGNVWAVMEEYPLARYGMDGMFFWPYLRTVLLEENPALLAQIDDQKLLVDMSINLAFVAGLATLEGLVFAGLRSEPLLLAVAAVAAVGFVIFYGAAVQYAWGMGEMVAQSFDLYRLHLLDMLGLARPDDLDEEYWTWLRLTAFFRRGEPFYFDMLPRAGEDDPGFEESA